MRRNSPKETVQDKMQAAMDGEGVLLSDFCVNYLETVQTASQVKVYDVATQKRRVLNYFDLFVMAQEGHPERHGKFKVLDSQEMPQGDELGYASDFRGGRLFGRITIAGCRGVEGGDKGEVPFKFQQAGQGEGFLKSFGLDKLLAQEYAKFAAAQPADRMKIAAAIVEFLGENEKFNEFVAKVVDRSPVMDPSKRNENIKLIKEHILGGLVYKLTADHANQLQIDIGNKGIKPSMSQADQSTKRANNLRNNPEIRKIQNLDKAFAGLGGAGNFDYELHKSHWKPTKVSSAPPTLTAPASPFLGVKLHGAHGPGSATPVATKKALSSTALAINVSQLQGLTAQERKEKLKEIKRETELKKATETPLPESPRGPSAEQMQAAKTPLPESPRSPSAEQKHGRGK